MTATNHYKANLRDIMFNLFELLRIQETTLGRGSYDMDEDDARAALAGICELAEGPYAEGFAAADREGLRYDGNGEVHVPDGVARSLAAWFDADWHLLESPPSLGGFGAPPSIAWSGFELVAGAHPAATFYLLGAVNARVIDRLGTPAQKTAFARPLIERKWGGTMVLTEPDAGSDVGEARSAAVPHDGSAIAHDGDVWELTGTKRFITNGDADCFENTIHLVLARPAGARAGTKGLSMFIVPKYLPVPGGKPGAIGARNGIYVTKVEEKMGLHASTTAEMVLGDDRGPCYGWLVGGVHDGIRQMFQVIEHARMAVGVKSYSTLSTAYLGALRYASERVQGPDLAEASDKSAPRVPIIRHPDVRRMLMAQKAYAEGMRSLTLYAAWCQDQVAILGGHGNEEAEHFDRRNDLLLPLVKGFNSEKAWEMLTLSLQTYGGSGYIADYPVEQYLRDQKIDTLYEGTTHIQALDLLFRKVARDGGQTFSALLADIGETAKGTGAPWTSVTADSLAEERAALARAIADVEGIFAALMEKMDASIYHVGLQANRVLFAIAELVIGWRLVLGAAVAAAARDGAGRRDAAFYTGKIAAARWWCRNVLPQLTLTRKLVAASALDLMALPDDAF
jgi:alkylation response protein AidB-like acyl-CoA dehydrogenase